MSQMNDFNRSIIEEFRASDGKVGGPFEGAPMVLLTTKGAKSGTTRVNPLAALPGDTDVLYVFASKGGAPTNPDWFHNLLAHPDVEVEFGDERYAATATPVTGEARDRLFAEQVRRMPGFGDYQRQTDRVIPVIELRRTR